jgi:mannose-1-phosphate guanylyltransferase
VEESLNFVSSHDALLTLGIKPDRPETGYGYIQINGIPPLEFGKSMFRKVKTFTEKPDIQLARVFMESGDFYWNAGIFFWSIQTIIKSFEKFLPDLNTAFHNGLLIYETPEEKEFIAKTYSVCNSISIDYGIMEKADNTFVLATDFGWSDLGTWGSLYDRVEKDKSNNAVIGDNIFIYDVKDSLISVPEEKLVILQGLENYIVVESDDILLVCKRDEEQRIKQFVNDVKIRKGEEYG